MIPVPSESTLRRVAVWGLLAPVAAMLVALPLAQALGGRSWPMPLVDLVAMVITVALIYAPMVGIVALALLVTSRR